MNSAIESDLILKPDLVLLAGSIVRAAQYLIKHVQEARQLAATGIMALPYVRVEKTATGGYSVAGITCCCEMCASACALACYLS